MLFVEYQLWWWTFVRIDWHMSSFSLWLNVQALSSLLDLFQRYLWKYVVVFCRIWCTALMENRLSMYHVLCSCLWWELWYCVRIYSYLLWTDRNLAQSTILYCIHSHLRLRCTHTKKTMQRSWHMLLFGFVHIIRFVIFHLSKIEITLTFSILESAAVCS